MKKSDLMTGMWVIFRNGKRGMILLNTKNGDIISGDSNWDSLNYYNNNLKNKARSDYDIAKVIQPSARKFYYNIDEDNNYNIVWEREIFNSADNLTVNISANIDQESIDEIKNTISKLEERLQNIKIGFNIKEGRG